MATMSFNIPDAVLPRVTEALCNGNNPTAAKAKQEIITYVMNRVESYEAAKADATARATHDAAIDAAMAKARSEISLS